MRSPMTDAFHALLALLTVHLVYVATGVYWNVRAGDTSLLLRAIFETRPLPFIVPMGGALAYALLAGRPTMSFATGFLAELAALGADPNLAARGLGFWAKDTLLASMLVGATTCSVAIAVDVAKRSGRERETVAEEPPDGGGSAPAPGRRRRNALLAGGFAPRVEAPGERAPRR